MRQRHVRTADRPTPKSSPALGRHRARHCGVAGRVVSRSTTSRCTDMPRTFYPLPINEIRRETDDTVSLAFDVPEPLTDTFRFSPGQFLTFRIPGVDGKPIDRSYSICSAPDDDELRVLVKRLEGGVFGERAHTSMAVGDLLDDLPPLGRFTTSVDPARTKAYLAIAAGSGISPVMSLMRAILATEHSSSR